MQILLSLVIGLFFGVYIKYTLNYFLLIPFAICLIILYILFKKKSLFSLISLIVFYFISSFTYKSEEYINEKVIIIEQKETYSILQGKHNKYISYDVKDYNLYSILFVEGSTQKLETKRSNLVSSFNDYLSKKGIGYELKIEKLKEATKGDIVRPKIKEYMVSILDKESASMIKMLVLGDKTDESDLYDSLVKISVVHLFVISGFHLNILGSIINKILRKKKDSILTCVLLFPYCYLLNFSIPIMRAFVYKFLNIINEKKSVNLDSFSILLITMSLFLLINYRLVFNTSFLLTFITNFVIIFLNNLRINNLLKKFIIMPTILYIFILPIINNINYEISLIGFLYASILSYPVSILYILCLLTSIFKISEPLLKIGINIVKKIIEVLGNINPTIITGKMTIQYIFVYYLLLIFMCYFLFIKKKKTSSILFMCTLLLLAFQAFKIDIIGQDKTVFVDVGQGDCTLVMGKHNKYNFLIDTGGSMYSDVANKKIIPILKSSGIRKLDYIFITHNDYDHCGALESLKENFVVEEIIYGENITMFKIGDLELYNLNTFYTSSSDDNDKSAVFYYEQNGRKFLIMGDASKRIERDIVNENVSINADILRIGHHGSNTSTSEELLSAINPSIAIISVGKNHYGHPNRDTLEILNIFKIPYYRTDYNGNICINKYGIVLNY